MVSGFSVEDILSKSEQRRSQHGFYLPHGHRRPFCCMRYHSADKLSTRSSPHESCHSVNEDDEDKVTRRPRTSITLCQREFLEGEFQKERYPTLAYIDKLSRQIQLPQYVIKVWFQNRRAKYRKEGHKRKQMKVEQSSTEVEERDIDLAKKVSSLAWSRQTDFTAPIICSAAYNYSSLPSRHVEPVNLFEESRVCRCSACKERTSYTRR